MSKIELFMQTHQKLRGKTLAASRDMNCHRAFKEVIVELKKHFEDIDVQAHVQTKPLSELSVDDVIHLFIFLILLLLLQLLQQLYLQLLILHLLLLQEA